MAKRKTVKKTLAKKSSLVRNSGRGNIIKEKYSIKRFVTRRNFIAVLALIILGILLYVFKGFFVAASVNGQPITRIELIRELEKKSGKQTLDSLVTKNLILQEMRKKNIKVTDTEVNAEMKKIEDALSKQGRTLTDALSQQGLTQQDLREQLKIQKMIEKLFAKDVVVTDKEIDKYIEDNKDSLPQGQDEKTLRASVLAQLKQQKLTSKFQTWLQEIQKNAKIQYFVTF